MKEQESFEWLQKECYVLNMELIFSDLLAKGVTKEEFSKVMDWVYDYGMVWQITKKYLNKNLEITLTDY